VQRPASTEAIVIARGLKRDGTKQLPIFSDDSNVVSGGQQYDSPVLVCETEADVSESAEVSDGHRTEAIDLVPTHAMVDECGLLSRPGFDECVEDGERGLPAERSVCSTHERH